MSKVQLALLNIMSAVIIAGTIMVRFYIFGDIVGMLWILLALLFLVFVVISVISIFKSSKLIKQQNEEKLKKSARLVKLFSIIFWIAAFILYKVMYLWGIEKILFLTSLYSVLLGTSVFSIAYIRLLYKEKKLSTGQAIIFTILQLILVLDIIAILVFIRPGKSKKSAREIARFFLGSYTPPGFFTVIADAFKRGPIPSASKKTGAFFANQWRHHRVRCGIVIAVLCLIPVGFYAYKFYQSRLPQLITVDYRVQAPGTIGDPENRPKLAVYFRGSAATLEMKNSEVPAGMITINPLIEGVWKWSDDDTLTFSTDQTWKIGKKYTVTFPKDFFPSHIKVENSFTFDIEDFSMRITESEFYIDPEDSEIKRVLFTVWTNYPLDTSSLEKNISIEPQIKADSGSLKKRPYLYSLTYNANRTLAYIVSEPLGMPAKTIEMQLMISAGVRDANNEGKPAGSQSAYVEIPGMTSYVRVDEMNYVTVKNDKQLYDRVLVMETRGSVDPAELAKNITAWILPKDLPELPGLKGRKDYRWDDVDDIVPEVLALSKKVNLEALPNELKYSSTNSWKFEAESGQYLYFKLNAGTKFYGGYVLDDSYEKIFRLGSFPRELSILSEGSILSFSGDKRLSIMSRGIKEVEYNIGRIRPDDINHLVSQTSGDVSNINFRNYNFNQYNITEQYTDKANVPIASERDIGYFSFDFSRYLENIPNKNLRHGLFIFTVRTWDNSYSDRRLIIVTDLGFFVKTNADSGKDIFVQSIASGNPVAGAAVNVIGLNGNPIFSTSTDSGGRARIPNFDNTYKNERAPTVYTVLSGEDMSFMAYNTNGRNLDYSAFDVGGIYGASDPKTLRAFLFSDRGLYRPGDEVRIGLVIKNDSWAGNLGGTPLEYRITDPRGAEINNKRIKLSSEGVEEIRFSTQDWSPTGTYTASVYVIREFEQGVRESYTFLGSQTVKVEEFLPDTLNVSAVFDPVPQDGWIAPGELKARVAVRNLFGTAASGNEVKAQINLSPGHQYFRQYRDYQFRDPYLAKNSFQEFLGTKTTNSEGTVEYNLNIAKFEKATYRLSFYTEAFEKGSGRNVSAETAVYVSPLPYLVGYKADGDLRYIARNTERMLSLIAINPKTQKTSVNDLTLTITELRYVSALVRQPNGVYKYQSIQKEYPVFSKQITIPAAGLDYPLPTKTPGEFKLLITGPGDLEYNSLSFSVAGSENIQRSLNRTAELEITMNKPDFKNGEEIELMIKAPYAGAGLITIERDKIYAHRWFRSSGETSMQTITVPADLEGNAYVNVHYLRSQDSPEIFMSPLCYGVVPFSISRENRTNRIKLDIPGEAKPGEDFVIKYSTARRGKIIVYAVDEGILQLAGYQTPNPLAFFFRKKALEVKTAQILDMVLPRYSVVQSLAAMGGGGGFDDEYLSRNLNPFKRKQNVPVAYWSGIVDSGPEAKELRYRVPDYFNGTLRVMAIAVSDSAIGAGEDRSLVRSTFIISPNAPMMAAPGDEFNISLTVTNNQKGAGEKGKVSLKAIPSEHLAISGNNEFNLDIPEGKDQTLNIPVKAVGPLGAAQIRFTASNNGETSALSAYMSVRPAVPYRVSLYSGAIKNKNAETSIDRNLYEEFHTREVSLSYLPMGMAKGLSFFLNNFPYGCSEQITSAVFPFLYPQLFKELKYTKAQADEGINRAIGILQARMKDNGAIGVWTSRSYDDPLITIYAAHFLTEARNANYYVPSSMMEKLLQACRNIASGSGTSFYDFTNRSYAIYILTLNEIVTTPLIESLKKDMSRNDETQTGLAGLYLAGSYALLQKTSDASSILGKIKRAMAKDKSFRYIDDLTYHSVYLNIISRHFPQRLKDISESLLVDMAQQMEMQSYTTFSANHALMAIDAYMKVVPTAQTGRFTVQEVSKDNQRSELKPLGTTLFSAPFSAGAAKIALENKDSLNLFYQITAAGFDRELPSKEIKNGIEVYREFLDSSGKTITSFKVGDEVTVKLNFRSLSDNEYRDVAIVDLCPAGLETQIESVRDQSSRDDWKADYVDIREDRLVIYGTVGSRIASFSYRARAINAGSFTVPPLFAEALYDKSVWALRPQASIKIVK